MPRLGWSLTSRMGVWGIAFTAYRVWRRLPRRHRRQIVRQVRKHGPRVASAAARRARRRRP